MTIVVGSRKGTRISTGLGIVWGGLVGVSIGLGGGWDSPARLLRGSRRYRDLYQVGSRVGLVDGCPIWAWRGGIVQHDC